MNKNVLIISSSPRKGGNSDLLCDEFAKGATESFNSVEKINLNDKKINFCLGCGVCNETHTCVQSDDMAELIQKMLDADVIVFASPVYFYTMAAQLKTFIDRCVPRYTDMSNKEFYYILTAAETNKDMLTKAVDSIRGFTLDCLEGTVEKGIVMGTGAWKIGEIKSTEAFEEAYLLGKNV